jgi:adenylate kinase
MIRVQLESESCAAGAVLDGFPRTLEQASSLDEMLRRLGKNIDYVLQLKVDDAQLIERMALRYNCSNCGATYNRKTKLPKQENICDECGASDFTARSDDEIEVFKHRLVTYHEKTNPLIEYYAQKGLLQSIDGMQDVAALSKEIALIAV